MQLLDRRIYSTGVRLFAFGCSHYGTEKHDHDLWIEFLKKVEATPDCVVFGLGDYTDFARAHWRGHLKGWNQEDNFFESIDDLVDGQLVRPFCAEIKKYCPSFSKKCVVLVEGNHHYKYGSGGRMGHTSTEEICRILDIPYGGLSAWVRMTLYRSKGTEKFGSGRNINVLLNHGQSSSSTNISAALGKLERQTVTGWRDVDILLSSHNHMLGHLVLTEVGIARRGRLKLIEHPVLVAKTGCFKKAYGDEASSTSYEEKNLFRPHARGWLECTVKIVHKEHHHPSSHEKLEFSDFNS